jgi:arylsulfatase A-like enzyme
VIACAVAVLLLAPVTARCSPANLILIVVDTLRSDHMGCYGYQRPTTPSIDSLAATAVRYERAFSQAPWTTPSVASLLTSRYPPELGMIDEPDRLDDSFTLLSEILADHGYTTYAVISHIYLGSKWNLDQGFDVYDESCIVGHEGVSSPCVTEAASKLINRHRSRPFFLLVHYFDPHYDYIEHDGYDLCEQLGYHGRLSSVASYKELSPLINQLDEHDIAHLRCLYDSEIAFTDAHIGKLLDELRETGLYDSSIIILTADHGEELLERSTIGHGGTLFNEQIKIPLMIRYPGSDRAEVVGTSVGLVDVLPTILDYLEVPVEHELAGTSLLDGGPAGEPTVRSVFSEAPWGGFQGIIRDRFKLLYHRGTDSYLLYDLAQDPYERSSILGVPGPKPPVAEQLKEELQQWVEAMANRAHQADSVSISMEERARLAALGYLHHPATPTVEDGTSPSSVRDDGFEVRLVLAILAISLSVVVFLLIVFRRQ